MLRESQVGTIAPLVAKINSNVQQIRFRAINNLYNKIVHNLIDNSLLINFPELPGVLMNWINDQCQINQRQYSASRMQYLLKVLSILATYIQYEQGLILLKQYQCLQFCEGFRRYFADNLINRGSKSLSNQILMVLDGIINKTTILGRSQPLLQSPQTSQTKKLENQKQTHHEEIIKQKPQKIIDNQSIKLKFKSLAISLPQQIQKRIFDLIVQLKYNKKTQRLDFLKQLLKIIKNYNKYFIRCKTQIFQQLNNILNQEKPIKNSTQKQKIQTGPSSELVCQIIYHLLDGLIWSHQQCFLKKSDFTHYNYFMTNNSQHWSRINEIEQQIEISINVNYFIEGFMVMQKIMEGFQKFKNQSESFVKYLDIFALKFQHSPKYFIRFLELTKENIPQEYFNLVCQTSEFYCQEFSWAADKLVTLLPAHIKQKVNSLVQYELQNQRQSGYTYLQPYLEAQFEISQNFHNFPTILQDFHKGFSGIQANPFAIVPLYLKSLLTLAISVARQDPLMAYYPEMRDIIFAISSHSSQKISTVLYAELLEYISAKKQQIIYLNRKQRSDQVTQMIFCQQAFVDNLLQNSLSSEKNVCLMLEIIKILCSKKKQQLFKNYIPILYALCSHPNSALIRNLSKDILGRIPKKYQLVVILLKLFSQDQEVRVKVLEEISQRHNQQLHVRDLVGKIASGYFKNNKKQLKISKQSIINYINITLNPDLQSEIRKSAAGQLCDHLDRMSPSSEAIEQLDDFLNILEEEIAKIFKKKDETQLLERYIRLYCILCCKPQLFNRYVNLQFMASLLGIVQNDHVKASLLILINQKVFQTPFNKDKSQKNWVMSYYPHIDLAKMPVLPPTVIFKQEQFTKSAKKVKSIRQYDLNIFQGYYCSNLYEIINVNQYHKTLNITLLQNYIVSACTHNNSSQISKLTFLLQSAKLIQDYSDKNKKIIPANNISAYLINYLTKQESSSSQNHNKKATGSSCSEIVSMICSLNYQITKNLEDYLNINNMNEQRLEPKLSLMENIAGSQTRKGIILDVERLQKLMKFCDSDLQIENLHKIYNILLNSKRIQWEQLGPYPSLRLIQSLIKIIKGEAPNIQNQIYLKFKAFLLIMRLIKQNKNYFMEHKSSMISLFSFLLFEKQQITSGVLIMILQCLVLMCPSFQYSEMEFLKQIINKTCRILNQIPIQPLISHQKAKGRINSPSIMLLTTIFNLINSAIKLQSSLSPQQNQQKNTLKQLTTLLDSNSCIDISVLFLNPKIICSFRSHAQNLDNKLLYLVTVLNQYLYLQCCRNTSNVQYLLKTTNLLANQFEIIANLFIQSSEVSAQEFDKSVRNCSQLYTDAVNGVGKLLYVLSQKTDLFILKVNKLLSSPQKSDILPQISQLFSFLAMPIFKMTALAQINPKNSYNNEYLTMFAWITLIWKNSSNHSQQKLQQEMKKVIKSYITLKALNLTHFLAAQDHQAQKQVLDTQQFNIYIKEGLKIIQGRLTQNKKKIKKKQKQNEQHPEKMQNQQNLIKKISEMLFFIKFLFSSQRVDLNNEEESQDENLQPTFRQRENIFLSIKFIDKVYSILILGHMKDLKSSTITFKGLEAYSKDFADDQQQNLRAQFRMTVCNIFSSFLAAPILSNYISQSNCIMVDKLIAKIVNIAQDDNIIHQDSKQDLTFLGQLCCCDSVRSLIFKHRVIEQINHRIIKMDQSKVVKMNYSQLYHICIFYSYLSIYKDANQKILNDKRILEVLCRICFVQKSELIQEKVLDLLTNLSSFKHSKATVMANKQIHKLCLGLLSDEKVDYKEKVLSVVYNILYKNAAGVKLYRKKQVIELLKSLNEDQMKNVSSQRTFYLSKMILEVLYSNGQ